MNEYLKSCATLCFHSLYIQVSPTDYARYYEISSHVAEKTNFAGLISHMQGCIPTSLMRTGLLMPAGERSKDFLKCFAGFFNSFLCFRLSLQSCYLGQVSLILRVEREA